MSWTTPEDIIERWRGSNAPSDVTKLQIDIDDVEAQIQYYYPNIQLRIDNNDLPLNLVISFVSRVVIEYWKTLGNPYSNVSEGVGSFNKSIGYNTEKARYSLNLTAEDYAILAPSKKGKSRAINAAPQMKGPNNNDLYSPLYGSKVIRIIY